jgi:putative FmdB family regulatory protein
MPVYCYKCDSCETSFEIRHSMFFEDQTCVKCGSEQIFKVPSILDIRKRKTTHRPGKVVDEYIKNAKEDLKIEKKDLLNKEL